MNRVIIPSQDFMALRQLGCDKLEAELDRADVLLAAEVPDDVVTMYSRVRYLDETTGERRSATLMYPDETDVGRGRISVLAPVGSALLGLSTGQSIDWEFPVARDAGYEWKRSCAARPDSRVARVRPRHARPLPLVAGVASHGELPVDDWAVESPKVLILPVPGPISARPHFTFHRGTPA